MNQVVTECERTIIRCMEQATDEQLVAAYRLAPGAPSGREAINELFHRYQARVALWCYRATGVRERAADLAQDIFTKAFRNLDSFRGDSKFSTWLYVIARNHCLSEMRSQSARPERALEVEDVETAFVDSPPIDQQLIERQGAGMLRRWMAELLEPDEAKAMLLHYGEDIPLDAITKLLGLTNPSGAKALIVSARRKLHRAARTLKQTGEHR